MNNFIIHNPTEAPVKDYPIENPATREVNLWSIGPGQTLKFPEYVARYLLEVYGFLQRVMTQEEKNQEDALKKKVQQNQQFNQTKIVEAPSTPAPRPTSLPGYVNQPAPLPPAPTNPTYVPNPAPQVQTPAGQLDQMMGSVAGDSVQGVQGNPA